MADVLHQLTIQSPVEQVFAAIVMPDGLNAWWTLTAAGVPALGAIYDWGFGPEYQWKARLVRFEPNQAISWEPSIAMEDWLGTRIEFSLRADGNATELRFAHTGWAEQSAHFRISSYCWATYLRLLKRFVERGERIPFSERND